MTEHEITFDLARGSAVITDVHVERGDLVQAQDLLVEAEVSKTVIEALSPVDGLVSAVYVQTGDRTEPGTVLAVVTA